MVWEDEEPPLHPNCNCTIEVFDSEDRTLRYLDELGDEDDMDGEDELDDLEKRLNEAERELNELYYEYLETNDARLLEAIEEVEEYIEELESEISEYSSKEAYLRLEFKFSCLKNVGAECEKKYCDKLLLYLRNGILI